jgi:type VI protein secretion system component VasK
MTDREPNDRKLLELATSWSLAPGTLLDESAAELREGWLAMGRALDGQNANFSEADLFARLLNEAEQRVEPNQPARVKQRDRLWPALLASALALGLLVAVMNTSWVGNQPKIATAPNSDQPAVDAARWTDPLDDELDAAAQQVSTLVVQGTGVDASLSNLADHLESMSDELTNGSL